MSEPIERPEGSAGRGHELTDAHSRPIAVFELALLLLIAGSMALMAAMFYYFTHREAALDTTRSPLADERTLHPQPNLQPNPAVDLEKLRANEDAQLSSYGWVDRDEELVRIPVERAMDIVGERGLPVREGQQR